MYDLSDVHTAVIKSIFITSDSRFPVKQETLSLVSTDGFVCTRSLRVCIWADMHVRTHMCLHARMHTHTHTHTHTHAHTHTSAILTYHNFFHTLLFISIFYYWHLCWYCIWLLIEKATMNILIQDTLFSPSFLCAVPKEVNRGCQNSWVWSHR